MSSINKIKTNDITYDVEDTSKQGLLIPGENITIENNVISAQNSYVLPVAGENTLGGVKVGENLSIDGLGKLSSKNFNIELKNVVGNIPAVVQSGDKYYKPSTNKIYTYIANAWDDGVEPSRGINYINLEDNRIYLYNGETLKLPVDPYTLPTASEIVLGGVKVGDNLSITQSGVLSAIDTTYTAGDNITISSNNVISAPDSVGQLDVMPTASEDYLNKVVQFVGTTDSNYTNGYFYRCESDGETPPTYSWVAIEVQESSDAEEPVGSVYQSYGVSWVYPTATAHTLMTKVINYFMKTGRIPTGVYQSTYGYNGRILQITKRVEENYAVFVVTFDGCRRDPVEAYGQRYYQVLPEAIQCFISRADYDNGVVTDVYNNSSLSNTRLDWSGAGGTTSNNLFVDYNAVKLIGKDNTISWIPVQDYGLVHKKYVDEKAIQVNTLPTADSSNVDKIYQYIGATDSNYTNGYFYQCISDGGDPATYSWSQIDVQPSSGVSLENDVIFLGNVNQYNSVANALDLNGLEKGKTYMLKSSNDTWFGGSDTQKFIYIKVSYNNTTYSTKIDFSLSEVSSLTTKYFPIYLYRNNEDIPETLSSGEVIIATITYTIISMDSGKQGIYPFGACVRLWNDRVFTGYGSYSAIVPVDLNSNQTISGVKTFNTLPKSSISPTDADHLTRKGYVDSYAVKKVSTMPTASSSYLGEVYQYLGTGDANYTYGYFYSCVVDSSTGTYSWSQIDVQPSSGSDPGVPSYWIADNGSSYQTISTNQKPVMTNIINYALSHNKNIPNGGFSINGYPRLSSINFTNYNNYVKATFYFRGYTRRYRSEYNNSWYSVYDGATFTVYLDPTEYTNGEVSTVYWNTSLDPSEGTSLSWNYSTQVFYAYNGTDLVNSSQVIWPTTSLPTASSSSVGRLYLYTGTTDSNYTNGYIYQCILDGSTYRWNVLKQATDNSYEVLMYDGLNSATSRTTINRYYDNIKNGIPTVLLLVTDQYPSGSGSATSATGKMIIPMSLDTTNPWSSTYRACLIGTAVSYDATDVYFAKQVLSFSGDTVTGLYTLQWLNKNYLELNDWFYRSGLSAYSTAATYNVGDFVYNNGQIYVCIIAVTAAEAFDNSKWTQITYLDYLSRVLIGNALGGSY